MDAAQYADLFLTESREHLSAINLALLEIERGLTPPGQAGEGPAEPGSTRQTTDATAAAIASLFRAVHTIKGMSATMRYDGVATLSHELEALLDRLRRGELVPDARLMNLLFAAADLLELSIERAVKGQQDDPRLESALGQIREATASSPELAATPARGTGKQPRHPRQASERRARAGADRATRQGSGRPS